LAIAGTLAAASMLAVPAQAQFEEPDARPKFGIGPFIEATFRGSRGRVSGTDRDVNLGFGNGAAFGLTADYRLGRTVSIDVSGSYGRSQEEVSSATGGDTFKAGKMALWQLWGELVFRIKPSVPGYFVLGGGARHVVPDEVDPDDPSTARFTREDAYTEPIITLGAGLEFPAGRHGAARVYFRIYTGPPADLGGLTISTNSLATDWALGAVFLVKPF
jgi:hypothetical protein